MIENKYNTYFWIQKKDESQKNMVIINDALSSFEKIPEEIISLKKREFLLSESTKTKISCYLAYPQKHVLYVDGITDEKDSVGRYVAYNFICESQQRIDWYFLEYVRKELLKCMDLVDSKTYFDEEDFNDVFARVDLNECNSPTKELLKREYANTPKNTILALGTLFGLGFWTAANVVLLTKKWMKHKKDARRK